MRFICSACRTILTGDPGREVECRLCGTKCKCPDGPTAPGAVIGDFAIIREIARGGMGIVYLARQISLDRLVALKILQEKYASDAQFVEDFIREARAAARISHPNIVQAYAVGEENGIYYFAMELIDGDTMKAVLKKEKRIEPHRAAEIVRSVADALDFAWTESKVVHQDIKPDNIMLTKRGQVKLADLGLSRIATGSKNLADDDDEVMGTPQYISPEQLTGQETDIRSDLYSLGATFYHFVTGEFPYKGKDGDEIARQHIEGTLIPPIEKQPDLPPELNRIILKMMAKNINERYQTGAELVTDLKNFLNGIPAQAKSPASAASPKVKVAVAPKVKVTVAPKVSVPAAPAEPKSNAPAAPAASKIVVSLMEDETQEDDEEPAAPAAPKINAPAAPKVNVPATPKINAPAVPAAPKGNAAVTLAVPKPPEGKSGLKLAKKTEEKSGGAPPVIQKIQQDQQEKKHFALPRWLKWTLHGVICFVLLVVLAFVALVWLRKMPEPLQPLEERFLKALNLTVQDGKVVRNTSAAPQDAPAQKPAATKPTAPALPPPPPKPTTRPELLRQTETLLGLATQGRIEEFLIGVDDFMVQYPTMQTPEETDARNRLLQAYALNDETVRVAPYRQQAHEKRVAAAEAAAEAAAKQAEKERRKREEAARIAEENKQRLAAAVQQAEAARKAQLDALKPRIEAYQAKKTQEQEALAGAFFSELGNPASERWKACRQAAMTAGPMPMDVQQAEKKAAADAAAFARSLDRDFALAGQLKQVLDDPANRAAIQMEVNNCLTNVDHFEKPHRVIVKDPLSDREFSLDIHRPRNRAGLMREMLKTPKIAAIYAKIPEKDRVPMLSSHLDLVCGDYPHLTRSKLIGEARRKFFSGLLEFFFADRIRNGTKEETDALKKICGEMPEFRKASEK